MILRDYQSEAIEAIHAGYERGVRAQLLVRAAA